MLQHLFVYFTLGKESHLWLKWSIYFYFGLRSGVKTKSPTLLLLKLVAVLKENGNYKDIYLLPVKAGFISKSTQTNVKLPSEATNSDKDVTVKRVLRFQELQAVLAVARGCTVEKLQHSDGM